MIENTGNVSDFPPAVVVFKGNVEIRNEQKRFVKDINGDLEDFFYSN